MRYKLKDIFDLQMGKTPSRNKLDYWNTEDYKWISIADLTKTGKYISKTKEYLSEKAVKESQIKVIPANTVIMSFKLSIGKVAITVEDMYSNEAIMAFHDKHVVEILPEYIYYLFKYKNWEEGINKAVMGKTLNKATLSDVEIEIHPIEEQQLIVDVLDKMMELLEGRETELVLLDDLIKARFVEMFGDPRLNEKGFKCKRGYELFKISNGKTVSNEKRFESGIPAYGGNGISWYTNTALFEEDTIVIGRVGFQSGNVHFVKGPMWITDNAMYISELYDDSLSLIFLCDMMEQIDFTRNQDAGDLKKVTQKPFMEMKYILPEKSLQKEYVDFVHQIDKSKAVIKKALDETQTLFDSLMQQYFG